MSTLLEEAAKAALCLSLACCASCFASDARFDVSQYRHTAWKVRDGFVSSSVEAVAQTQDGYLWLATRSGLYRFDGVRAVPWKAPAGAQLPGDVRTMRTARDGRLWIGTIKGLASWKDGKLDRYPQLDGMYIASIAEDEAGTVWVGGQRDEATGELCAMRTGRVECVGDARKLGRFVTEVREDAGGRLWVATVDGVWLWQPGPPKFFPLAGEKCGILLGDDGVRVLSTTGLARIDARDGVVGMDAMEVRCGGHTFQDRDGSLWIPTIDRGLLHAHGGTTDAFGQAQGLSGDYVRTIFQDREGTIWVGTTDGLDRFADVGIEIIGEKQGLADGSVTSVLAASDGSIWMGTLDGLSRWKNGQITTYRSPVGRRSSSIEHAPADARTPLGVRRSAREIVEDGLPDSYISSLFEDQRHRIWIATRRGLASFQDERFTAVSIPERRKLEPWVFSFAADPAGNLWISQSRGLFRLHDEVVDDIPWSALGHKAAARSALADPARGGVWLGFADRGITYYEGGKVAATVTTAEGLGPGAVTSLRFDAEGALWAATEGGLARIKDGRAANLSGQNGLPCDRVHWSAQTSDGAHWLYTACGLVRIAREEIEAWKADPKRSVRFRLLDVYDGVRSEPYPSGASPIVATTADGKLWFRQADGVSVVDPLRLRSNKLAPPVTIEQVVADGKSYEPSTGPVRLPALIRNVAIDYTALSFVAPEKMHFRYKLEGQDAEWRDVVNDREVQYSNLAPGRYRFRVTASNDSGVWNEQGATLDLEVAPAFWQTNWFRALCVVALAALLFGLYLLRVRQLRRRFALTLETRVAERTRIARDLHDTLLQSFHGLLLRFQTARSLLPANPSRAAEMLDNAIDQAADAITEGRDAVQALRTSTTEMNNLAAAIRTLADELLTQRGPGAGVSIGVEVLGVTRALHPIVRDEAFRIAGEALRNALNHAASRQIEVELVYDRQQFRLRVRDNGKGIDPQVLAQQGRQGHFGLPGMRERAAVIGGKLAVWSALDAGTEIELTVRATNAYRPASRQEEPAESSP